ncbi:MAG TPA: VIT and VWA domain-containing protein [Gemmatimonadaceae bacterium]|nr:VIT and VWA domain-containing protein [Gemmatimonadaceae bacterium]
MRVELASGVLRYEVSETFVNNGGALGEADYIFPLPRNAAFRDLRLMINGELVSGETMPADRARAIYEEIVRSQRDPALVEWFDHGLLRARIFPIAPGERKQVVVRFDVVAERQGDALRIDYFRGTEPRPQPGGPMPMLERRGSGGDDPESRSRPASSTFRLRYASSASLGRAYSPTHSLSESRDGSWRVFESSGGGAAITVLVPRASGSRPAVSVLTHATAADDRYVMLTLSPGEARSVPAARDVAFVLDVSGSMKGEKMRQAIRAGEALLRTLRPSDFFRIIAFSTEAESFRSSSVVASAANVSAAVRYLRDLEAEGSTNIEAALEHALDHEPRGIPIILFLTDGLPTVGERSQSRLAQMAADRRGRARVFTFGLGADVNVALMEELAIEGRGTAQFVRPSESIERVVSLVAQRLGTPVITDLRLEANGVRLRQIYPRLPADVFAGQDLVIMARYEGEGRANIELTGTSAQGAVRIPVAATFPARERDNPFVARLWAIRRIGYLTAERRRAGGSSEVDDEIRELGQRFGIPTELSSYLVLEPDMERFRDGAMRLSEVTVSGVSSATSTRRTGNAGASPTAPPPARPETTGAQAFESARTSASQRNASSLDAAANVAGDMSGNVRNAAGRTFVLRAGIWSDVGGVATGARVVRVQPFSELYFTLMREIPQLREILALGERVLVHGKRVTIELHPEGVARLTQPEIEAIVRDW